MKLKKLIAIAFVMLLFANCEKNDDLNELPESLIGTTWIGVETYKCTKDSGCIEQQILKFNSENKFTFQHIDGEDGRYDTILSGTYTYSHPELTLQLEIGTLPAILNGNKICLDSGSDCSETSAETLIKQ